VPESKSLQFDVITHEIIGADIQALLITLAAADEIRAEAGRGTKR
jgi:hypothetical protein